MASSSLIINRNVAHVKREHCVELMLKDRKISVKVSDNLYCLLLRIAGEKFSINDLGLEKNSAAFEVIKALIFYDILIEERKDKLLENGILRNAARINMEACSIPDESIQGWCFFGVPVDFALDPPRSPAHGSYVYRKFSHSHKLMTDLGDVVYTTEDNIYSFGEKIQHVVSKIKEKYNRVIMFGGDHSLTYFSVKEIKKYYPDVVLIQFDAHSDINTTLERENKSVYHANFVSKLLEDGLSSVVQIGVREKTKRYSDNYLASYSVFQFPSLMDSNDILKLKKIINNKPIYISFDVDVIDPSLFPHVTTPLNNGMKIQDILDIICIIKEANCILTGADIMEFTCGFDEKGEAFNHETWMLDAVIELIIS